MSEGTSPSSSFDEGNKSTPSNLPKAATRARKKRTSDSEDEDYVAVEEEATSKRKVLKKEYGTPAATKPGMKKKVPAKRVPMSKARSSTQETLGYAPKEQVVVALGKLLGVLLLPSSEVLEGSEPSLSCTCSSDLF